MRLWTRHPPDFCLVSGTFDLGKSPYKDEPAIMEAYDRLAGILGTRAILWADTVNRPWFLRPDCQMNFWVLDVPDEQILRFADENIWNRCWSNHSVTSDLSRKWLDEAHRQFPGDPSAWDASVKKQEQAYVNETPPRGDWWNALFVERQIGRGINALLKHPIEQNWVVETTLITGEGKIIRPEADATRED